MAAPTNGNNYNITVNTYDNTHQGFINVVPGCNSFTVINLGDTLATVNDIPLFPSPTPATDAGDAVIISGNELDIYKGNIKLAFAFPVGANPKVVIIQQFYTAYAN